MAQSLCVPRPLARFKRAIVPMLAIAALAFSGTAGGDAGQVRPGGRRTEWMAEVARFTGSERFGAAAP